MDMLVGVGVFVAFVIVILINPTYDIQAIEVDSPFVLLVLLFSLLG